MASNNTNSTPLVEMRDIHKAFGGIRAVDGVSIAAYEGEVLGIVGHNGAGKSTLIKILSGAYVMDSGEIFISGEPANINNPRDAQSYGIETLYQDLALAPNLNGAANLFLGREKITRFGRVNNERMLKDTREVVTRINPKFKAIEEPVFRLSGGQQQSIAIARAIYFNAKVLIMDEPTAALGPSESAMFQELVVRLREEGIAMLLISHDMHQVFEMSDRITVMAGGRVVGTHQANEVTSDQILSMIIMGQSPGKKKLHSEVT
ncbi:MAG: ABC transporter ATP-binding protein [Acidiferrobacteraceae bacterium]|nr:ABC transporter ATP-binding protein [Acidiferrobacteraceae bacterium]|tara:strand:+ start:8975 stop:9760 length:786 start_codon:yes stop_codon:yes gene_type:complete